MKISANKFCFCLPLKKGLLVVGCIKLLSSLLAVIYAFDDGTFSGNILAMMPLIDSIFNATLIVAVYKENLKFFKLYFYYGAVVLTLTIISIPIVFMGAETESFIILFCEMLVLPYGIGIYIEWRSSVLTFGVVISSILFQTYLLLLVLGKVRALQKSSDDGSEATREEPAPTPV